MQVRWLLLRYVCLCIVGIHGALLSAQILFRCKPFDLRNRWFLGGLTRSMLHLGLKLAEIHIFLLSLSALSGAHGADVGHIADIAPFLVLLLWRLRMQLTEWRPMLRRSVMSICWRRHHFIDDHIRRRQVLCAAIGAAI